MLEMRRSLVKKLSFEHWLMKKKLRPAHNLPSKHRVTPNGLIGKQNEH